MKSIFQSNRNSRRHRQAHSDEQKQAEQQPFFGAQGSQTFFQPKLSIGQTDDPYEREADAVADQVVNADTKSSPAVQTKPITPLQPGALQRLATPEEEKMPSTNDERMAEDKRIQEKPESPAADEKKKEEPLQMMQSPEEKDKPLQNKVTPEKREEKDVQTKPESTPAKNSGGKDMSARLSAQKGAGEQLPDATRVYMEHQIGADFSEVRIHTDAEAVNMNQDLRAQAFTHGADIYFNSGKYSPESTPGKRLLAHELTHVVQQGGGDGKQINCSEENDTIQRWSWPWEDDQERTNARSGEAQRERGKGQDEMGRRVSGASHSQDGSGKWGADAADRGITDYANREMWFQVANAAELGGLTNAARHMRHYLGNSGSPISVSVDDMMRDVPALQQSYNQLLEKAKKDAEKKIRTTRGRVNQFSLTGERLSTVYCQKSVSPDWFFAVGGFTHWFTAEVNVIKNADGSFSIEMTFILHMYDRYNWDHGKSVTIMGITVTDDQLGRLHRVGLAREFNVVGVSSPENMNWNYTIRTGTSTEEEIPDAPASDSRSGGRTDPGRERK